MNNDNKKKGRGLKAYTITDEQLQALTKSLYNQISSDVKTSNELSIRQRVKKLLYSLPELRTHIDNKSRFIERLAQDSQRERSKDIVKLPSGGGSADGVNGLTLNEKVNDIVEKRERSFEETIQYMEWVDSCIDAVKVEERKRYGDDGYFRIVELKYFERLTVEKIAEMLNFADTTAKYHHNRLLRSLAIQFFGEKGNEF